MFHFVKYAGENHTLYSAVMNILTKLEMCTTSVYPVLIDANLLGIRWLNEGICVGFLEAGDQQYRRSELIPTTFSNF